MSLKDTRFLSELSKETGISVRQLTRKIDKLIKEGILIEYEDYRKAEGKRGTYILSKSGVNKIIGGRQ